jgi:hypothetical protein
MHTENCMGRRKSACTVALGPHINHRIERAIKAQFNEKILRYNLKPYIGRLI